ncbi:MAG: hypothetical protein Q4D11_02050 [Rhodospirillales bacterium]|nr:hypothetical protein [Rhodospirillales bacterium]
MKKILLTLMALCFWMSVIPDARADFELLETVLSALENIQKKVQVVQEKYQKIESQLNALRQGPLGKLTAISSKLDFKNISVRTLPIVSENIGNLRNLEKAIQKGTMANLGKKNQIILSAANEKNNADIMREDLSRLYAYAFTLRTSMARDHQKENDSPSILENNRATKQMLKKETMETARRFTRILDMQSSLNEFQRRLIAANLRVPESDEDDTTEEGDKQ